MVSDEELIIKTINKLILKGSKNGFYDLYYLLKKYSISEMIDLFDSKNQNYNHLHVLKSLTYFDDAENDEEPVLLKNADWSNVKNKIIESVKALI